MDVHALENDGTKTYIGWLTSKPTAALLSRAADRIVNPEQYNIHGNKTPRGARLHQGRHSPQTNELIMPGPVDKLAAEMIIKWINGNSISNPQQFELKDALDQEGNLTFATALDIHRAGHAFDLDWRLRGNMIRNNMLDYIDDHRDFSLPTADDFKQYLEKVDFESALPDRMMKAIMWRCAHKSLDQDIIDAIKQYCRDTGNYESMKVIGDKNVAQLVTSGKYKGKKVIEHGW